MLSIFEAPVSDCVFVAKRCERQISRQVKRFRRAARWLVELPVDQHPGFGPICTRLCHAWKSLTEDLLAGLPAEEAMRELSVDDAARLVLVMSLMHSRDFDGHSLRMVKAPPAVRHFPWPWKVPGYPHDGRAWARMYCQRESVALVERALDLLQALDVESQASEMPANGEPLAFPGSWYFKVTKEALSGDTLKKAFFDRRIHGSKGADGKNRYELESVCGYWKHLASVIRLAAQSAAPHSK